MTGIWRAIYYTLNIEYPDRYIPSEETKRQRHLVHKQIRESKIKLKKVIIELPDSDNDSDYDI